MRSWTCTELRSSGLSFSACVSCVRFVDLLQFARSLDSPRADVVYGDEGYSALQVGAAFPREHTRAFANVTRDGGILLSRSVWAGSQGLGAASWSGDTRSEFAWLKLQIPAGLNMAMSGQSWWTTDAGGFNGLNNDVPSDRELLVRWLQFATVCPIMRIHGARKCNETAGFSTCPVRSPLHNQSVCFACDSWASACCVTRWLVFTE